MEFDGLLKIANPQVAGWTHKPYIVTEAGRPNQAAKVDGKYWLLSVAVRKEKITRNTFIAPGRLPWRAVDVRKRAADSGRRAWGLRRETHGRGFRVVLSAAAGISLFLHGLSAVGSATRHQPVWKCAGRRIAEGRRSAGDEARHDPSAGSNQRPLGERLFGRRTAGTGKSHRWIAMINASPLRLSSAMVLFMPKNRPPSLGGFAFCDEEWPVKGWQFAPQPIEWIEQIPPQAIAAGEGVNLWRHHLLILPNNNCAVFYNTGSYGKSSFYVKWGDLIRRTILGRRGVCGYRMAPEVLRRSI